MASFIELPIRENSTSPDIVVINTASIHGAEPYGNETIVTLSFDFVDGKRLTVTIPYSEFKERLATALNEGISLYRASAPSRK